MKINKNIKSIIIGCIIAMGVSYVSADWSGPKIPPPNCITDPTSVNYNEACNAPINIGLSSQAKTGDLTLVRSFVGSLKVINDFTFATGTPTAGQVLTAVDGTGKVGWGTVSGNAASSVIALGLTSISPPTFIPANRCPSAIRIDFSMDAFRGDGPSNDSSGKYAYFSILDNSTVASDGSIVFGSTKGGDAGHYWGYKLSLGKTIYLSSTVNHNISSQTVYNPADSSSRITISNQKYSITCI